MDEFATSLLRTLEAVPSRGTIHVAAWELGTKHDAVLVLADDVVPAASMIKVPIFAAVLSRVADGRLDLEQPVNVPPRRAGGSGILYGMPRIELLTLADLLTLMIIVSDNTATNVLIDLVGQTHINRFCAAHGLTGTTLRRRMMDIDAIRLGLDNTTTARDQARMFDLLAGDKLLTGRLRDFAMAVLANQQFNEGLRSFIPKEVPVFHKTGELPGVRHDAGIIAASSGRQAVVAVLVSDVRESRIESPGDSYMAGRDALSSIAAIGHAAWRLLEDEVQSFVES
jgi:beta-lactamase class A